jgi:hypothetical protein
MPAPIVSELERQGEDALADISPYLTEHVNRFGDYTLKLERKPPQPDYTYVCFLGLRRICYLGDFRRRG